VQTTPSLFPDSLLCKLHRRHFQIVYCANYAAAISRYSTVQTTPSLTSLDHNLPHNAFYMHHSTELHSRQKFLTCDILHSSLFHYLFGILTKAMILTVWWSRRTIYMFVLLHLPPWRWTPEWP